MLCNQRACKTVSLKIRLTKNHGFKKALEPREVFDNALCGVCSASGRFIYSEFAVVDLIRLQLEEMDRPDVNPEEGHYEKEAWSFYKEFLLGPIFQTPLTPIYLRDPDE